MKEEIQNDFDTMLFDKIIAYDHLKEKLIIIVNMKTNDTKAQYELAKKDIKIISTITSPYLLVTRVTGASQENHKHIFKRRVLQNG